MQMRPLFLTTIFCALLSGSLHAQTSLLPDRQSEALSPSENRFDTHAQSMDSRQFNQLYSNPVYYEWVHTDDSLYSKHPYRSTVYTGYAEGEQKGDFLPYEGNASRDCRIGASGEYSLRWGGTLFGSAQYSRGQHKNIGWSAMRYPELYTPYISTDSCGGHFEFEDYLIQGGYAFTLNDWKLGVKAMFHGEQAHRMTDPRALNNTTWLNLGVGVSRRFNGHLLMLDGSFGRNKQHMNLRYWRPGQQDRFFVCYGFGLYDNRMSGVAFGYQRMYYIMEGHTRLTYQSPLNRPFTVYASMGYEFDRMKTEETNICDLYYSKTHTLLPTVRLDWQPSASWMFSLWLDGRIDLRKGFENIFERYKSNDANFVYDYRLIDTQQNYKFNKMHLLGQLRAKYQINPKHAVALTGGLSSDFRQETYDLEDFEMKNTSLFPHGRLDYLMRVKHSELELSALYGKKLNGDNTYKVYHTNQAIQHLDFQHAFAPFAYYDSEYSSLQVSAGYTYHFKKCAVGLNAQLMYTDGERNRETYYDGKIGFNSSAPMINREPDRHDELWGSTSVYFLF